MCGVVVWCVCARARAYVRACVCVVLRPVLNAANALKRVNVFMLCIPNNLPNILSFIRLLIHSFIHSLTYLFTELEGCSSEKGINKHAFVQCKSP